MKVFFVPMLLFVFNAFSLFKLAMGECTTQTEAFLYRTEIYEGCRWKEKVSFELFIKNRLEKT